MAKDHPSLAVRLPPGVRAKLDCAAAAETLKRGRTVRLADLVRESLAAHLGIEDITDVVLGRPPAVARHRVRPASPPAAA